MRHRHILNKSSWSCGTLCFVTIIVSPHMRAPWHLAEAVALQQPEKGVCAKVSDTWSPPKPRSEISGHSVVTTEPNTNLCVSRARCARLPLLPSRERTGLRVALRPQAAGPTAAASLSRAGTCLPLDPRAPQTTWPGLQGCKPNGSHGVPATAP